MKWKQLLHWGHRHHRHAVVNSIISILSDRNLADCCLQRELIPEASIIFPVSIFIKDNGDPSRLSLNKHMTICVVTAPLFGFPKRIFRKQLVKKLTSMHVGFQTRTLHRMSSWIDSTQFSLPRAFSVLTILHQCVIMLTVFAHNQESNKACAFQLDRDRSAVILLSHTILYSYSHGFLQSVLTIPDLNFTACRLSKGGAWDLRLRRGQQRLACWAKSCRQ